MDGQRMFLTWPTIFAKLKNNNRHSRGISLFTSEPECTWMDTINKNVMRLKTVNKDVGGGGGVSSLRFTITNKQLNF